MYVSEEGEFPSMILDIVMSLRVLITQMDITTIVLRTQNSVMSLHAKLASTLQVSRQFYVDTIAHRILLYYFVYYINF